MIMEDYPLHYYFIGRLLGKALYENLLVELPLASFFLCKMTGTGTYACIYLHCKTLCIKNIIGCQKVVIWVLATLEMYV